MTIAGLVETRPAQCSTNSAPSRPKVSESPPLNPPNAEELRILRDEVDPQRLILG